MNERNQLLAAIRQTPEEDMPRLAYADWLDENTESDHDTATAEFIRVSCNNRNRTRKTMPKAAYKWIHQNYQRLLQVDITERFMPFVNDKSRLVKCDPGLLSGKEVEFQFYEIAVSSPLLLASFRVSYYRGFIERIDYIQRINHEFRLVEFEAVRQLRRTIFWRVFSGNPLCLCEPFSLLYPPEFSREFKGQIARLYREETGREFERLNLNAHPADTRHHVMEFLLEEIARQESRERLPLLRITRETQGD